MNAPQVVKAIGEVGITLDLVDDGERLLARPTELVTPEIVATLREHRMQLITELRFRKDPARWPRQTPLTTTPRDLARAAQMGLCAMWARREFGYVSVHDPLTGEWHNLPTKDANFGDAPWMISGAQRRKALWKNGDRRAYKYTSAEMEAMWAAEGVPLPTEGPAAVDSHGVLWEDYITEEDD